jgi:hypothetical protein
MPEQKRIEMKAKLFIDQLPFAFRFRYAADL